MKKISIYDIAKYSNVSPASVSYVINGVNKVSPETRKKVLKAIEELGYVMDHNARTLSTGKSHLIGLLLPLDDTSKSLLQNPFYYEFVSGLQAVITNFDYDIVIGGIKNQENIKTWSQSRRLDGIILLGDYPKNIYEDIKNLAIPVVLTDVYEDYADQFNNVRILDEDSMYKATKYLIECGHKKIAFVGNKNYSLVDKERYNGYRRAMDEASLSFDKFYETTVSFDGGHEVAKQILEDNQVSAVVCAADIIALGVMRFYKENNKIIPDDLSVVGFDDIQNARYAYPGLTTIHQDILEKGKQAAEVIMENINSNTVGNQLFNIPTKLVIRESVKIKSR